MRSSTLVWILIGLFSAAMAEARPPHKRSLKNYYGERLAAQLNACRTCHLTREEAGSADFDDEAPPHNPFGVRLRELGEEWEAAGKPIDVALRLRQVAGEDADGDGVANELEILAGHWPGNKVDLPGEAELVVAKQRQAEMLATASQYAWAPFQPVQRPSVPDVADRAWVRNPIDAFVAAEHQKRGLKPRPEAARHVLLRRLYLDLVGLPPTRDELQAFLADSAQDAYEKQVERLLGSPQYGERWGRHWMDVWRYSDWAGWGQQVRDSQPHIWRWRDWIVESLNADKPYNRMVQEMLAGDELAPGNTDTLRATGYLVRNYKRLSREQWMQDTVEHTAKGFLGLTINCARCHNHLYDPITQEEYYRLRAVFEPYDVRLDRVPGEVNPEKAGLARIFDNNGAAPTYLFVRGDEKQFDKDKTLSPATPKLLAGRELKAEPVALPAAAYYPGLQAFVQQDLIAQADAQLKTATEALAAARQALAAAAKPAEAPKPADAAATATAAPATTPVPVADKLTAALTQAEKSMAAAQAARADLTARIAADHARFATPPDARAAELTAAAAVAERQTALARAEESVARIELKLIDLRAAVKPGDDASQKPVAGAEKELAAAREVVEKSRAALSQPTTSYAPLTPTYPATSTGRRLALARWITDPKNPLTARVAVNHMWLRHFGRGIVESVFDFGQNGTPPTHPALLDYLAAELVERSWSMKAVHRLMVTSSTYRMASSEEAECRKVDPDNRYLWQMPLRRMEAETVRDSVLYVCGQLDLQLGGADIAHENGQAVKRRSLYFRSAAEKQMAFLKLFDGPAVNECYQRKQSIMPQQALALANSELVLVQARLLARQLNKQFPEERQFIGSAFEQVLARPATAAEVDASISFLAEQNKLLSDNRERLMTVAADQADASKPSADIPQRTRETLVHALLNHNDFVTIH